jgi:CsoR family transcriptional regulator, copper-sensing transcriptional repressor
MQPESQSAKKTRSVVRTKPQRRPAELQMDLLARLDRAEGQLRGIKRLVSEEAYCIDILQQISAVRGALQKLALILLRDHLETCVTDAMATKNTGGKIKELIETLDRFVS